MHDLKEHVSNPKCASYYEYNLRTLSVALQWQCYLLVRACAVITPHFAVPLQWGVISI